MIEDQYLDLLYIQTLSQLIRMKNSPTYVERRILGEHIQMIRNHLLQYVDELKKKVAEDDNKTERSYMVWDRKFYEERKQQREKDIKAFVAKINNLLPSDFISRDLSSISEELETSFPNHLPKSLVQERVAKEWAIISKKHD